jgi:hypothetical protein
MNEERQPKPSVIQIAWKRYVFRHTKRWKIAFITDFPGEETGPRGLNRAHNEDEYLYKLQLLLRASLATLPIQPYEN